MKQSQKDSFIVTTTLASTKLTQNTGLLQLLKYGSEHGVRMDPNKLRGTLMTFNKNITAQEFAKFMQDVLDALFNILMENENEAYDNQVFRTIVDTILLITDDRSKFFFRFCSPSLLKKKLDSTQILLESGINIALRLHLFIFGFFLGQNQLAYTL